MLFLDQLAFVDSPRTSPHVHQQVASFGSSDLHFRGVAQPCGLYSRSMPQARNVLFHQQRHVFGMTAHRVGVTGILSRIRVSASGVNITVGRNDESHRLSATLGRC